MKSERRHDLKTNALARRLETVPQNWRDYGSKVLLAVIVALIVFLLVRYWNEKKAREGAEVSSGMVIVNSALRQIDDLPFAYFSLPPSAVIEERQRITQEADQAINNILNVAKDPKVLANTYLAQAELDWKLANLPEFPGADTQPSLRMSNRESLLDESRSWYQKVLDPPSTPDPLQVYTARLGLAAIAEDLRQWDQARQQYEAIDSTPGIPTPSKDYAKARLTQLPDEQKPVLIVPPPPPTTAPSTNPSTEGPGTVLGPLAPPSLTQPATNQPAVQPPPASASQPATRGS